ncbi:hypothetical protein RYX56_24940, partial [Alkalihalophilus lindianensis]
IFSNMIDAEQNRRFSYRTKDNGQQNDDNKPNDIPKAVGINRSTFRKAVQYLLIPSAATAYLSEKAGSGSQLNDGFN